METTSTLGRKSWKHLYRCFLIISFLILPYRIEAQDVSDLSITQLMQLDITSVAKKSQKLSEAAAAVFVITAEDIRRSGVTSIPEALRMAPGLQVARIGAYRWAITSRGFNDAFANNLLVLIDGRTVYTPLFAGVFWDTQDILIEDIDRIEVIRGPGASLWGANAVNGVINIITKSSKDSQGALISGGGGSEERGFAGGRYGGKIGVDTSYRAYAKWFDRDDFKATVDDPEASTERGNWWALRSGFRLDSDISENDSLTLQGDAHHTTESQELEVQPEGFPLFPDAPRYADKQGANILGRWERVFSETSDMKLQMYYDFVDREDSSFEHQRNTYDIDFQHRFLPAERHDLIWGAGYRHHNDDSDGDFLLSLQPDSRSFDLYTWFFQDDISLIENELKLIVGSKFEDNPHTGFEFQPTIRSIWTPDPKHSWWLSFSRAVRTPSRINDDVRTVLSKIEPSIGGDPTFAMLLGDRGFDSVELYGLEIGHRAQIHKRVSFDITAFYNTYDNFLSAEPGFPEFISEPEPYVIVPVTFDNLLEAETHGVELVVDWKAMDWWRFVLTYSYFNASIYGSKSTDTFIFSDYENHGPEHQTMLRSQVDLPYDLEFDSNLRFVDDTKFSSDYLELDLRLGWRPTKNWEFSIAGQNLLDSSHREWLDNRFGQPPIEVDRGVYGKVTWRMN